MGVLARALPRDQQGGDSSRTATVQSAKGVYRGLFVGMTDPVERVNEWGEKCRVCKGTGTGYNGEGECRVCHGTKKRTEEKVKLMYSLENGVVEQEEMNFKLTGPGTGRDGTPLSPSTLFVRMAELSGIENPTEQKLDDWYSNLATPIKIPVQVIIGNNQKATALKITEVLRHQPNVQKARPATTATHVDAQVHEAPDVEPWNEDDWAGYEDRR